MVVGDVGVDIILTMIDPLTDQPDPLVGAESAVIVFVVGDVRKEFDAEVQGSDVVYRTVDGDIDAAGTAIFQAVVTFADGRTLHSKPGRAMVNEAL